MKFKYLSIIIILFSIISCDKDTEENKIDNKPLSAIEQKIIKFKTDLTSSQKDELVYDITEAEWYLEGLLNYEEANNEHSYHNLQFVQDVYNVPVVNGTISNSELLAAYTQFLGEITEIVEDETLFSDLVDIAIVEPETKDGTMDIEMTYSYGSGIPLLTYDPFLENEDWLICGEWGACGNNPSTENSNAEEQLEYKFNHPNITGQTGFFSSVNHTGFFAPTEFLEDPENNPGNELGRTRIMLYNCSTTDCIPYNELNYYLGKFDYIKSVRVPSDKTFKSVQVETSLWTKKNDKEGPWFHVYDIYYGNFTISQGGQQ